MMKLLKFALKQLHQLYVLLPLKPKAVAYVISGQCLYMKMQSFHLYLYHLPVIINSVSFVELSVVMISGK